MNAVERILGKIGFKKTAQKTLEQYKEELWLSEGREQFKALLQRGLRIPVVKAL